MPSSGKIPKGKKGRQRDSVSFTTDFKPYRGGMKARRKIGKEKGRPPPSQWSSIVEARVSKEPICEQRDRSAMETRKSSPGARLGSRKKAHCRKLPSCFRASSNALHLCKGAVVHDHFRSARGGAQPIRRGCMWLTYSCSCVGMCKRHFHCGLYVLREKDFKTTTVDKFTVIH